MAAVREATALDVALDLSRRLAVTEIHLREEKARNLRLSRENAELRQRLAELEQEPAQCA